MSNPLATSLTSEKALIFRITHRDNLPWIFDKGLHCRSAAQKDPNFVTIGNPDLIQKRESRAVPLSPGGTLADYIPFYFTPYSPMMYNIHTGYGGVPRRENEEILVLVSSLHQVAAASIPFVFTDRHAYLQLATFSNQLSELDLVSFSLLQARDFSRDPNDPEKMERYQAEALVHQALPAAALLGVVCYDSNTLAGIESEAQQRGLTLKTYARPSWFFQ